MVPNRDKKNLWRSAEIPLVPHKTFIICHGTLQSVRAWLVERDLLHSMVTGLTQNWLSRKLGAELKKAPMSKLDITECFQFRMDILFSMLPLLVCAS